MRSARTKRIVTGLALVFLLAVGAVVVSSGSRPLPDRIWMALREAPDGALPLDDHLYLDPAGPMLEGFAADGSEKALLLSPTDPPSAIERALEWCGLLSPPWTRYLATGDHVDRDGVRWEEFVREDD